MACALFGGCPLCFARSWLSDSTFTLRTPEVPVSLRWKATRQTGHSDPPKTISTREVFLAFQSEPIDSGSAAFESSCGAAVDAELRAGDEAGWFTGIEAGFVKFFESMFAEAVVSAKAGTPDVAENIQNKQAVLIKSLKFLRPFSSIQPPVVKKFTISLTMITIRNCQLM
ncbi:unnamed protein product [Sphagnum jensenii]|uniref:Uncharacterized protein n=1 Tax=Sphagnum jensenii TaxID=128206 RepID=A0ABP0VEV8_9BRYO